MSKSIDAGAELRSYGGEAGDARVARRRSALIHAAVDMLTVPAPSPVTVRGVCASAGLTPRYFYESFDSIDVLVGVAYDEVITEIADRARGAFDAGNTPREKVSGAVEAIVDVIESDPRKGRLIFSDAIGGPVLAARRADSLQMFANLTSESVAQMAPIRSTRESMAVAHFQVGGLSRVLASWTEGRLDLDRSRLIALCVGMMMPERRGRVGRTR